MRSLVLLAPLALPLLSACTASHAAYYVLDAERKYQAAVAVGGEERAVYETTIAREYLWKAKEEVNDADYGAAEQLCKKSVAWSAKALERAEDRGVGVRNAEDFVPETKPEKPVEKPDETPIDIDLDDL